MPMGSSLTSIVVTFLKCSALQIQPIVRYQVGRLMLVQSARNIEAGRTHNTLGGHDFV